MDLEKERWIGRSCIGAKTDARKGLPGADQGSRTKRAYRKSAASPGLNPNGGFGGEAPTKRETCVVLSKAQQFCFSNRGLPNVACPSGWFHQ